MESVWRPSRRSTRRTHDGHVHNDTSIPTNTNQVSKGRIILKNLLNPLSQLHACWYGITTLPSSHPDSFVKLLNLSEKDFERFMKICEFMETSSAPNPVKCTANFKATSFELFFAPIKNIELDEITLPSDLGGGKAHVVRIGQYNHKQVFNAKKQIVRRQVEVSQHDKSLPCFKAFKDAVTKLLKENEEQDHRNVATTKKEQDEKKTAQHGAREKRIGPNTPLREAIGVRTITEEITPERYPLLSKLDANFKDDFVVQALLRDLDKLTKRVKSISLRQFEAANDKNRAWIVIPRSSSLYRFRINKYDNVEKYSWVDELLNGIIPQPSDGKQQNETTPAGTDDIDILLEEDTGSSPADAARWLMIELGRSFPDEFSKAAEAIGMPIRSQAMSPEAAFAMFQDANIGTRGARLLRKHLVANGMSFLPSEKKIRSLGDGGLHPSIATTKIDNKDTQFSYRPLDKIVQHYLPMYFEADTTKSLDIVVGADHGQGALRSATKLILRAATGNHAKKNVLEISMGEIDCTKDTYNILDSCLATPLNNALDAMLPREVSEATGPSPDGYVVMKYHPTDETKLEATFLQSLNMLETERAVSIAVIPFRIFIAGDLAFYSTCLGKDSASGAWCWRCDMGKTTWNKDKDARGNDWTFQSLCSCAVKVSRNRKMKRHLGVKQKPMLKRIGIDRYVPPVLHEMLGIGNTIFKHMLSYIDESKLETIPVALQQARHKRVLAAADLEEIKEEYMLWAALYGAKLQDITDERQALNQLLKDKDDLGYSQEEVQEGLERKELLSASIKKLRKEKNKLEDQQKAAAENLRKASKAVKSEGSKLSNADRSVLARIEAECLEPFKIDRAAYHGGDLTGKPVKQLMSHAEEVINKVIEVLTDVNNDKHCYNDDELAMFLEPMEKYGKLLTLFDGFFQLCRCTEEEVQSNPAILDKTKEYIKKAMKLWRHMGISVTPKAHGCEVHNHEFMVTYNTGLGDFDEEFVERRHQSGVLDKIRTRSMRNRSVKYLHFARYEHAKANPNIKRIKKEVHQKQKRKFSKAVTKQRENSVKKEDQAKIIRKRKRTEVFEGFVEPPSETVPTILSIEVAKELQDRENDALLVENTEETGEL